jgi:hypothetical protein
MAKRLYLGPQTYWDLSDDADLGELEGRIRNAMTDVTAVVDVDIIHDWVRGRLLLNAGQIPAVALLDNNPDADSRIAH